ncbi:hypothetical protein ACSBM8_14360 [Sphingomonas sp. ASY06-1R]|uniref:hypothetical protein n=1 Tax=Sphingomonas sp. ASY06-1R TaxID=3445771 RepID=UPI003FA2A5E8
MTAFHLDMDAAADLLCRIVGLLAQRDLQIASIGSTETVNHGLRLRIDVDGLDAGSARIIAAKMLRCVGVDRVWLETDGMLLVEEALCQAPRATPPVIAAASC